MSRRFVELVVRARRLVAPTPMRRAPGQGHATARRQMGGEVTQFSFRLAFMIDLVYVGLGAFGGAALGRGVIDPLAFAPVLGPHCLSDSSVDRRSAEPTNQRSLGDSASARTGTWTLRVDSSVIPGVVR